MIGGILLTAIVFLCIACIIKFGNKLIDVRTNKTIATELEEKREKSAARKKAATGAANVAEDNRGDVMDSARKPITAYM